jgi:Zn-dependent peptidase ImmA (M78 family)
MPRISSAIVRACQRRVQELVGHPDERRLPVDVVAVARQLGVRAVEPANLGIDGYVGVAADGSTVIRYRKSNTLERNRFTIAHEIGHLLIAEATEIAISAQKSRTGFDSEELIANQLAAELLVPADSLKKHLGCDLPSWGRVQHIRKQFNVSSYTLLRRLTEIEGVAAVFATFDCGDGRITRWRFCTSTTVPQLSFTAPFSKLVGVALQSNTRTRFIAHADLAGENVQIPCEVRGVNSKMAAQSWAYGWRPI